MTDYLDYREVVLAWMAEMPNVRTQGLLSLRTGRASSTISMTVQRKRPLQPDDAELWGKAMRLSGEDLAHFVDLVRSAHGTEQERAEATERVLARRAFAQRAPLPLDHEVFGRSSTWALLALVDCEGFRPDPAWIAATLVPPITEDEARDALDLLVTAGLVSLGPDGAVHKTDVPVAVADNEAQVERWNALHAEQLGYALSALAAPSEDRHLVGVVAAIAHKRLPELVARLEGAIREVLVDQEDYPVDRVVQISLQIIPRSKQSK